MNNFVLDLSIVISSSYQTFTFHMFKFCYNVQEFLIGETSISISKITIARNTSIVTVNLN